MCISRFLLRLLVVGGVVFGAQGASADEQPNILVIFSDDLSFHDVGAYGNPEVRTPNIDRLAEEGVTFTHAYNMGSWHGAVCVPSRTMLQSGLFLWHAREEGQHAWGGRDHEAWLEEGRYWPQLMKEAGYRTYMTGKWHVGGVSVHDLYDVVRHERGGMPNQTWEGYDRPSIPSQADPWSPYDMEFGGYWEGGKHWSEVVADDFEIMLEDAQEHEEPFFMYICFNAPHDPRQSPREFVEMYPRREVCIPDNFLPEYPYNEEMGSGRGLRDERLAPFPRTVYSTRVQRQEYYAIITHMDHQIGRILRALEASGEAENTWVVHSADHGLAVGQHGLMGKQNMYDHSLRVPFIITGPGIEGSREIETPIYLQDMMPTGLEIAGVEVPDYVQFRSVLPLIRGERESSYDAIYGGYREDRQRAVIDNGYKLIVYPRAETIRLYNLEEDPYEVYDLAEDPEYKGVIKQLMTRLQGLQQETGDGLNLPEAFPKWF